MYKTSFAGQIITLDYSDTSLKLGKSTARRLKPWMEDFLSAAEDFLWSQNAGALGFSRPAKGARVHLSLVLCGKSKMKSLNARFRQKAAPTDVLSLQYIDDREELSQVSGAYPLQLGDIFICREVALAQASRFKLEFEEEFVHLLVHGFLHTLDYDHERGVKEEKEMELLEKWILSRISRYRKKRLK